MFNLKKLFYSFKFALRGFFSLVKNEQNFRVHLLVAIAVVLGGIYFHIKLWQWSLIVIMIAAVFVLEILNTVFERLTDILQPRLHHYVGEIKDMMSTVVLVASVASAIIGLLVFVPYIFHLN